MGGKQQEPRHKFVWAKGGASCTCGWAPPWLITGAPRVKLRKQLRDTGKPELINALSRALSVRTISRREAVVVWAAHVALGERTARAEGTDTTDKPAANRKGAA